MSELGPFLAWCAAAWAIFALTNSVSGLVDAWRTRALCRADKTRAEAAALLRGDPDHVCDVDDCDTFRCEACGRHAHSVGMPDGWAFDTEESVYLCGDCQDEEDHDEPSGGAS